MPLLAIVQPFMAPVEGIGIIVITIVLMIVIVTRSARQMQGQIRNATRLIRAALGGAHARGFIRSPRHRHDHADPDLASDSEGVGKKLSELDLHTNSGAVVLAIGRGDSEVIVPTGDEILRPGDVLELAGSSDAVAAARRILETPHARPTASLP